MDTISQLYRENYLKGQIGMINMVRQAIITDRMKELAVYQKVKYKFYRVPILCEFLEEDFKASLALLVEPDKFLDYIQVFIPVISILEPQ